MQRDAAALLDAAAFDDEQIASASVEVDVRFRHEHERAAFLDEYLESVRGLFDRYGAKRGERYRLLMAAYPSRDRSEGVKMGDYRRTFEFMVPPERVWRAFVEPQELQQWFTKRFDVPDDGAAGPSTSESPGGRVSFEVVAAEPNTRLQYRQWAGSPEAGIDVTVTFEAVEHGTRITVTHAGFGGESILRSDGVRTGMDEAYADLALYLDHGVSFPRHRDLPAPSTLGAFARDTQAGPVITAVEPGGLAGAVGLQPGDLVVQLGHGGVFGNREIAFFLHEHEPGEEVDVAWVRDGTLRRGRGRLTPRDEELFARLA